MPPVAIKTSASHLCCHASPRKVRPAQPSLRAPARPAWEGAIMATAATTESATERAARKPRQVSSMKRRKVGEARVPPGSSS